LPTGISLLRRFTVPANGKDIVFEKAFALRVTVPEAVLRLCVPLVRAFAVPTNGLNGV
jgi:hypothetical protein